ncbi:MAG: hypothetical protein PHI11_01255 [Gallionella sp.]|nr:hypothetical protein [Gallionella sp.]
MTAPQDIPPYSSAINSLTNAIKETEIAETQEIGTYSSRRVVVFWLLWLLGLGFCLLFALFFFMALSPKLWIAALWNLLMTGIEGYLLVKLAYNYSQRTKSMDELLSKATFLSFAMPFISFGGCLVTIIGQDIAG